MIKILKYIVFSLIAVTSVQCNGQVEKGVIYPNKKIMTTDKFDLEKYNKIVKEKKKKGEPNVYTHIDKLDNGTIIRSSQAQDNTSTVIIVPVAPAIFETYKSYHSNGYLETKTQRFLGLAMGANVIKTGVSEFYNKKGELIKSIDENAKYENINVKPEDLFEILKKTPLFSSINFKEASYFNKILQIGKKENEITGLDVCNALKKHVFLDVTYQEEVRKVFITLSKDEKTWNVTRDLYPFGMVTIEINTTNGEIMNHTYQKEVRS